MVITTFFAPAVPDGVVIVTEVDELTVTLVADVPPIVTEVEAEKFVPVIVISPVNLSPEISGTVHRYKLSLIQLWLMLTEPMDFV